MSGSEDQLLYVLSACREMSWQSFRKAFDILRARDMPAEDDGEELSRLRWRAARMLDCLGHCDLAVGGGSYRLYAAPPVLARLPHQGPPQAVLCGARAPGTIPALQAACERSGCRLEVQGQSVTNAGTFVPQRVIVEAGAEEAIDRVAREIRSGYPPSPPAWAMLQFSGSLHEYLASRPLVHGPDLNWPRRDFDARTLQFRFPGDVPEHARLCRYEHPLRPMTVCYLWSGDRYREVERDWGCYALLRHAGVQVLAYDPRRFVLAVPSGAPLPRLLARACALCSGAAPAFVRRAGVALPSPERSGFHVFHGVPPVVAREVASKVGQRLSVTDLKTILVE